MENNKKQLWILVVAVVVLLVIGSVVYCLKAKYSTTAPEMTQPVVLDNQIEQTIQPVESTDSSFIKRIIFTSKNKLFSSALNGTDVINLSEKLSLDTRLGRVTSNSDLTRIVFMTRKEGQLTVWSASSTGEDLKKVFETVDTGCNELTVTDLSPDGTAIIFDYSGFVEPEVGVCTPKTDSILARGWYYLKDGQELRVLSASDGSYHFYGNEVLYYQFSTNNSFNRSRLSSVWVTNPLTQESRKLFDVPVETMWSAYTPQLFPTRMSDKVVFELHATNDCCQLDRSQITVYDLTKNTSDVIATGTFAEYQGVSVSPQGENIIYEQHTRFDASSGIVRIGYFVYNVKTKVSTPLNFYSSTEHLEFRWKDDNSFFYRSPLIKGWPVDNNGNVALFNLKDFSSTKILDGVSDIFQSRFNFLSIYY